MRYILIDPVQQTVSEAEHAGLIDWRVICEKIGCSTMTCAGRLPNGDILWVDDEGLLKGPQHYFRMDSVNTQPLAGRGMITGPEDYLPPGREAEDGEEINNAQSSVDDVRAAVIFLDRMAVTETTMTERELPGMRVFELRHKIEPA